MRVASRAPSHFLKARVKVPSLLKGAGYRVGSHPGRAESFDQSKSGFGSVGMFLCESPGVFGCLLPDPRPAIDATTSGTVACDVSEGVVRESTSDWRVEVIPTPREAVDVMSGPDVLDVIPVPVWCGCFAVEVCWVVCVVVFVFLVGGCVLVPWPVLLGSLAPDVVPVVVLPVVGGMSGVVVVGGVRPVVVSSMRGKGVVRPGVAVGVAVGVSGRRPPVVSRAGMTSPVVVSRAGVASPVVVSRAGVASPVVVSGGRWVVVGW